MVTTELNQNEAPFTILPAPLVQFFSQPAGTEVASINIVDGELRFTGNADAAALIFFNEILKPLCDNYIADRCAEEDSG